MAKNITFYGIKGKNNMSTKLHQKRKLKKEAATAASAEEAEILRKARRRNNYTDDVEYKAICAKAAVDDEAFNNFKSQNKYRSMLEHANSVHGHDHLKAIKEQTPELMEHLDKFRTNDTVGTPNLTSFAVKMPGNPHQIGDLSSTTMQYIRVLSDLITYFGNMDGMKIVEIGAGYGGQCKIINDYVNFSEYICFEMSEPSQLVRKYLDHFKIKNAVSIDAYEFYDSPFDIKCDLVISNFAFSEQSVHIQDCYLKHILKAADRGYLWMNETAASHGIEGIKNILPHELNEKSDIPSERDTNRILYWNKE